MLQREHLKCAARRLAPIAAIAALVAGCASASKTNTAPAPNTAGASTHSSTTGMAGMAMGTTSTNASAAAASEMSVAGIKPVATQILGTADWQGMKIAAQAMTPVPFVIYNGTRERIVKPGHASFHLMVMLATYRPGSRSPTPRCGQRSPTTASSSPTSASGQCSRATWAHTTAMTSRSPARATTNSACSSARPFQQGTSSTRTYG